MFQLIGQRNVKQRRKVHGKDLRNCETEEFLKDVRGDQKAENTEQVTEDDTCFKNVAWLKVDD